MWPVPETPMRKSSLFLFLNMWPVPATPMHKSSLNLKVWQLPATCNYAIFETNHAAGINYPHEINTQENDTGKEAE
jgi:hypothetical protein